MPVAAVKARAEAIQLSKAGLAAKHGSNNLISCKDSGRQIEAFQRHWPVHVLPVKAIVMSKLPSQTLVRCRVCHLNSHPTL